MGKIDIIPIKLNQEIPSKDNWYHIQLIGNDFTIEMVLDRIKYDIEKRFNLDYDNLIIIKNRKVISVI